MVAETILPPTFLVERFFCRFLYPLGAYLGFKSKLCGINVVKREITAVNVASVQKLLQGHCVKYDRCGKVR